MSPTRPRRAVPRADAKVRHQLRSYQRMVELAADAISILDASMRFQFVNPAMEAMLGYGPDELVGATLASVTHESTPVRDRSEQRWRRGETERIEYCHRRKDGSPLWVTLSIAPLTDDDGNITGCIGVSRDITQDRDLRQALAASEAAYHSIFDNLQDVYFELDAHGRVIVASPSALRHTGYTPDELVGQHVQALLPDVDAFGDLLDQLEATGTVSDFETLFIRKTGEHCWVSIAVSAVPGPGGESAGFHGMLRDVTARRRAEADRDRLFALSVDMLAVVGPDGRYKRLNPAWTATTGYPLSELLGRNPIGMTHPDDRERVAEAYQSLAGGQRVRDLRIRLLCADAQYRWLSMNVAAAEGGEFFAVVRDVTALVEAEEHEREVAEERERLRLEAEHAANHDPLTGMLNRRAWFNIAAERRWSSMALFDIDYFKAINDTFGHAAGDKVLVDMTAIMARVLAGRGHLARVGGEEFGILFAAPISVASVLCEQIIDAVNDERFRLPGGEVASVTLSAGLAACSAVPGTGTRESAISQTYIAADRALYRAKALGRARLCIEERSEAGAA